MVKRGHSVGEKRTGGTLWEREGTLWEKKGMGALCEK